MGVAAIVAGWDGCGLVLVLAFCANVDWPKVPSMTTRTAVNTLLEKRKGSQKQGLFMIVSL